MFSTFDLRLLLYVIRLAGWLKHCNLSLWQQILRYHHRTIALDNVRLIKLAMVDGFALEMVEWCASVPREGLTKSERLLAGQSL